MTAGIVLYIRRVNPQPGKVFKHSLFFYVSNVLFTSVTPCSALPNTSVCRKKLRERIRCCQRKHLILAYPQINQDIPKEKT